VGKYGKTNGAPQKKINKKAIFYYSFIHMHIHCLGHFSLLPHPHPLPPPFQAELVLHFSPVPLKSRNKQ
jgi:hypothetical protein